MKVLIVASWYPSKNNSIAGVFIKEQVKAIKLSGIDVVVLFPYDNSIPKGKLKLNIEDRIETYRCNTDYMDNSSISRLNSIFLTTKYIKKIVIEKEIEIIHSQVCYPAGFSTFFYSLIHKVPYIITEHMSTIGDYSKQWYNKVLFKLAYKNAESVICVSKSLCYELKELKYDFNEIILGNVTDIDQDFISNTYETKNIFHSLFIGSMDQNEGKGIQYLLPALKKVKEKRPDINIDLTLIGDGIKMQSYVMMAKQLNLEENCVFLGRILKEDIPTYIKKCDFLIQPSLKETFGCVLIESMAYGKPVLATKCGGPEDFVNDNVGILVEKKDIGQIEEGIEKIVDEYSKYDEKIIRKYVIDNFSYKAIGNSIKNIYTKILKE